MRGSFIGNAYQTQGLYKIYRNTHIRQNVRIVSFSSFLHFD